MPSSPSRSASGPSRLTLPRFKHARPPSLAVVETRPEHTRILLSAAHRAPPRSSRSLARHASDPGHTWSPPRLVAGPSHDLLGWSQRRTFLWNREPPSSRGGPIPRGLPAACPHRGQRPARRRKRTRSTCSFSRTPSWLRPGKPWTPRRRESRRRCGLSGLSDARMTRTFARRRCFLTRQSLHANASSWGSIRVRCMNDNETLLRLYGSPGVIPTRSGIARALFKSAAALGGLGSLARRRRSRSGSVGALSGRRQRSGPFMDAAR